MVTPPMAKAMAVVMNGATAALFSAVREASVPQSSTAPKPQAVAARAEMVSLPSLMRACPVVPV